MLLPVKNGAFQDWFCTASATTVLSKAAAIKTVTTIIHLWNDRNGDPVDDDDDDDDDGSFECCRTIESSWDCDSIVSIVGPCCVRC